MGDLFGLFLPKLKCQQLVNAQSMFPFTIKAPLTTLQKCTFPTTGFLEHPQMLQKMMSHHNRQFPFISIKEYLHFEGKYFLIISGISSSSDQQSLIQQPKSILKQPSVGSDGRYNEYSMDGAQSGSGYHHNMPTTNTHRSLAESSASGVSQVLLVLSQLPVLS